MPVCARDALYAVGWLCEGEGGTRASSWAHMLPGSEEGLALLRHVGRRVLSAQRHGREDCAMCSTVLGLLYVIDGTFTDESWPRGGFIPAETLVHNGTAGDNGTAGGTLNQSVIGFLLG